MNRRDQLAARRRMLEARCEVQRQELSISVGGVAHSFRKVDTVVGVVRRTAEHPFLIAGAVVIAVVIFRPRRLLRGISLGLAAATAARRASTLLRASA